MSEQDIPVLDELDRRARTAAAALRHSIDTLVADDAAAAVDLDRAVRPNGVDPTGPAGPAGADGDGPSGPPTPIETAPLPEPGRPGPAEPTVIHLGPQPLRRPGRTARRWFLAAAAVAVLAAVGGAVAVVTDDDGGPDVSSGGRADHFLPDWLPPGFAPVSVTDIPDARSALGFEYDVAVYGDPDADDPWSTPVAVLHLAADEGLVGDPRDGEAVTVDGHDALLREAEPDGIWVVGHDPGWEVERQVDDGRLIVIGALDRDEVLAAAAAATAEPAIGGSGLPDGYTELARGPFDGADFLMTTSLFEGNLGDSGDAPVDGGSGLVVAYADPSDRATVRPAIAVGQRPGPSSAVDLQQLWMPDSEPTSVRGRHAVISRDDEQPGSAGEAGVVAIRWAEPDGQLVTVVGHGVDEDAVLQVAEGLGPASAGEVAGLRQTVVAAPREFADVPDGHVVAASGESGTGRWRVVAGNPGSLESLTLERMQGAIGSTSSGSGSLVRAPSDPLEYLWADFADGTVVVWGVLWVEAASVTVEAPDADPVALDIQEVEGWDHPVVAGSFPIDQYGFPPSDEVVVVARDADGREVARNATVLGG
jgi:hypothetical protein